MTCIKHEPILYIHYKKFVILKMLVKIENILEYDLDKVPDEMQCTKLATTACRLAPNMYMIKIPLKI